MCARRVQCTVPAGGPSQAALAAAARGGVCITLHSPVQLALIVHQVPGCAMQLRRRATEATCRGMPEQQCTQPAVPRRSKRRCAQGLGRCWQRAQRTQRAQRAPVASVSPHTSTEASASSCGALGREASLNASWGSGLQRSQRGCHRRGASTRTGSHSLGQLIAQLAQLGRCSAHGSTCCQPLAHAAQQWRPWQQQAVSSHMTAAVRAAHPHPGLTAPEFSDRAGTSASADRMGASWMLRPTSARAAGAARPPAPRAAGSAARCPGALPA